VTSFDTNILFAALAKHAVGHESARNFLHEHQENEDIAICELVLLELYALLRNPTVCPKALPARAATDVVQSFRHHPFWRIVDYAPQIADDLWQAAAKTSFRYKTIFDARLALTLRHHGVTELATRNVKDFRDFGFQTVWDPLA